MRVIALLLLLSSLPSFAQERTDADVDHVVIPRTTWDPGFVAFAGEVAYDEHSVFCARPPLSFTPPRQLPTPCGLPRPLDGVVVPQRADDVVAPSIVIHHTDFGDAPGPVVIRDYHLQVSGFADIGYHFVVSPDGRIFEGRPIHLLGAHAGISAEGRDDKTKDPDYFAVGVVLDGFYGIGPPPRAQLEALQWLVHALRERYDIDARRLFGHRDVKHDLVERRGLHLESNPTTCPGDGAYPFVEALRAKELLAP